MRRQDHRFYRDDLVMGAGIMGDEDELPNDPYLPAQVPQRHAVTAEWDLCLGVLQQAAYDLRLCGSSRRDELRLDALGWVEASDAFSVFSFVNVCGYLGIDVEATRARLLAIKPRSRRRAAIAA